ncbi:hypothetical protein [Flavobacterium sp. SM2513]|uniref:hypothetical protein n=1 Tax=Flavobacterium sp. SM2513 TaxID=3424766 RepID=UPI003D7F7AC9
MNEPDCRFQSTHPSDRGVQYWSALYVRLLKNSNIKINTAENGNSFENAFVERINGFIKEEYLNDYKFNPIPMVKDASASFFVG